MIQAFSVQVKIDKGKVFASTSQACRLDAWGIIFGIPEGIIDSDD
jgi:hypothetical protein